MHDQKQQDKIWEYFQTQGVETFRGACARLDYLAKQCSSGDCVLDVGVGSGDFEDFALKRNINVHSLDPSVNSIEMIRQRYHLGDKAVVAYAQEMPFKNDYFDKVVMSEVLEHLTDKILISSLKEVKRVLKPRGLLLGTVPAREVLKDNMVSCPHCDQAFHRWGHERSFTMESMKELLSTEFSNVSVKEVIFMPTVKMQWLGIFSPLIRPVCLKLGLKRPIFNIVFKAQKL